MSKSFYSDKSIGIVVCEMSDGMDEEEKLEIEELVREKEKLDREEERIYVEMLGLQVDILRRLTKIMKGETQKLQKTISEFEQFEQKERGKKLPDLSIVENQLPSLELAINVAESSVKVLEEYANSLRRRLGKEGK